MTALMGFTEIAQSADRVLRRDPAYQAELSDWTRTDPADDAPSAAGGQVGDSPAHGPDAYRHTVSGRGIEAEPLIAILGSAGDSGTDQIRAGQALQRVLLTATDAGLTCSLISQPIEVTAAREQLRRSLGRSGTPQMTLRVGYSRPGLSTTRRRVEDVIVA
jgi:hypothetical protein